MSKKIIKGIKKLAQKTYKKFPKKNKIIGKASSIAAEQIIGGPYINVLKGTYKSVKKKAISHGGYYAYKKFLRSEFTKNHLNSVPIAILSLIMRTLVGALIISHTKVGLWWIDFTISIALTIIITLLSPFFFISIKAHESFFMDYTNLFIENLISSERGSYLENMKNVVLIGLCLLTIIILQFVEVNSGYLQIILIHTLTTGIVVDILERRMYSKIRIYYGMTRINNQPIKIEETKMKQPTRIEVRFGNQRRKARIIYVCKRDGPTILSENHSYLQPLTTNSLKIIDEYVPSY